MKNKELQNSIHTLERARSAMLPTACKTVIQAIKDEFPAKEVRNIDLRLDSLYQDRSTEAIISVSIRSLDSLFMVFKISLKYNFEYQRFCPLVNLKTVQDNTDIYNSEADTTELRRGPIIKFSEILYRIANKATDTSPLVEYSPIRI